ncbi:hypothetical protein BH23CHL4_BH23CHL4_16740 [soil metagenome]
MPQEADVLADHDAAICISRSYFDTLLTHAANYDELQTLLALIRLMGGQPGGTVVIDEELIMRSQELNAVLSTTAVSQTSTSRIMRALNQSVGRGALIRSSVVKDNRQSIVYQLAGSKTPPQDAEDQATVSLHGDAAGSAANHNGQSASVYAAYENNIGLLTPLVADQIQLALQLYPASWIHEAISEAVAYNRRQWRYIQRVLQNWSADGRISGPANEVNHETNRRGPARAIDTD